VISDPAPATHESSWWSFRRLAEPRRNPWAVKSIRCPDATKCIGAWRTAPNAGREHFAALQVVEPSVPGDAYLMQVSKAGRSWSQVQAEHAEAIQYVRVEAVDLCWALWMLLGEVAASPWFAP
jgi:hypothetical protein